MKRIIPFLSLLIVLSWSCQQEPDDMLPDTDPGTPADSTLLYKFCEIDETLPAGADTTSTMLYSYDNQKRIKRKEYTDHTSTLPFRVIDDYFYQGADTLPYKAIWWATESNFIYIDTIFYTYANGVVAKDSSISYEPTGMHTVSVETYAISGDNVLAHRVVKVYNGSVLVEEHVSDRSFITRRQNGNIVEQTNLDDLSDFRYQAVTYNDKRDPLYKTAVPYPVLDELVFGYPKHLMTEQIYGRDNANPIYHYLYSYTYRSDGYPLVLRISDAADPGGGNYKAVYIYK